MIKRIKFPTKIMQLYWRETRGFLWSDYNELKLQNMKELWLEVRKSFWHHSGELNVFHFLRTDCGMVISVDIKNWKVKLSELFFQFLIPRFLHSIGWDNVQLNWYIKYDVKILCKRSGKHLKLFLCVFHKSIFKTWKMCENERVSKI